ncbi:hypothetical protein DYB37_005249 [Aphanomyces astaci]|uniref:Uncharacterized protein n=1 Tax=Aphanomyces astaci TaxID=112090 RepID=A0A3R6ZHL0_APHAT|nr:hypothetical protein DYB35_006128 [Aphanomyces astaci]RHZ05906.1 hypothetical protein DYB37_005249 [Aphanomyces astaci]
MPRVPTGRELTDDQRLAVYHRLLQLKTNGRVHGVVNGRSKDVAVEAATGQETESQDESTETLTDTAASTLLVILCSWRI